MSSRFAPLRTLLVLAIWVPCSACYAPQTIPCLSGAVPSVVDRPRQSELLELARLEYERSRESPPALAAHLFERFPTLLPDVSGRRPQPDCSYEFVERMADATFSSGPIEYSALLVSRIRAVGNVGDTTDVMAAKASFLLRLAQARDAELSTYRLLPGERGAPPPKALVRQLATGELAGSNLFFNDARVKSFLSARLRASEDPRELLLVHAAAAQELREAPLGNRPGGPKVRLLERWLDELPVQTGRSAGPEELELVLLRLRLIGRYAEALFSGDRARSLLRELSTRSHELGIVSPHPGIARDLAVALRSALFDLERQVNLSQGGSVEWPVRRRPAFDPYAGWLAPTILALEPDVARQRLADLERDLEHFEFPESRCAILADMPRYADASSASSLFERWLRPAPAGEKRPVQESRCRLEAALALPGLEDRKAALLARLVEPERLARDGEGFLEGVVAESLAGRPGLVWKRQELLDWALARARLPASEAPYGVQQLAHALLASSAAQPDANARAELLRVWIAELSALPASGRAPKPPGRWGIDLIGQSTLHERLFAIADFAASLDLTSEARALTDELLARYGGPSDDPARVGLARAAAIAQTLLDQR